MDRIVTRQNLPDPRRGFVAGPENGPDFYRISSKSKAKLEITFDAAPSVGADHRASAIGAAEVKEIEHPETACHCKAYGI